MNYRHEFDNADECVFKSDPNGFTLNQYHLHSKYEILLILSGQVKILTSSNAISIDRPAAVLHKPYTMHLVMADKNRIYDRYLIYFDDEFVRNMPSKYVNLPALFASDTTVCPLNDASVEHIMYYIKPYMKNYSMAAGFFLLGIILSELENALDGNMSAEKYNSGTYVRDVMRYINKNYGEKITTPDLAAKFYISTAKLNYDFRHFTSISLRQYLINVRLMNAKLMLENRHSVVTTSSGCGFRNECHFIRSFKKQFQLTPYQYSLKNQKSREL